MVRDGPELTILLLLLGTIVVLAVAVVLVVVVVAVVVVAVVLPRITGTAGTSRRWKVKVRIGLERLVWMSWTTS